MTVKTVRTATVGSVELGANEHIHYLLRALGAEPIFNHACEEGVLLEQSNFSGHPKMNYEWVLRRAGEPVSGLGDEVLVRKTDKDQDNHGVALSYLFSEEYTLLIEHHDQDHSTIEVLSDKDYEAASPSDFDRTSFKVFRS